jgi:hypothetical protein
VSTLNFNVNGDPGDDQPAIIADNPPGATQLASHFEGVEGQTPNRFVVTVPPTLTGGASLFYKNRTESLRVILPPGNGSWEADNPPCRPPEYGPEVSMALEYAATAAKRRSGIVRFAGRAWIDDGGPYYPLGDTILYALGHWHRGGQKRDLLKENARLLQDAGHDYVRWLGGVNWQNDMDINPDWAEYIDDASGLLDFLYNECGLRSKVTVTGGGIDARAASEKLKRVIGAGRHHMIQVVESVNEQNDSSANAIWIAQSMRELGVPTSTGRGNAGGDAIRNDGNIAGSSVDILHTERGLGDRNEPGGEHARQVRQCWDFKDFGRPSENGEPPGPTSSGNTLDDPFQIALFRAGSIICGAGAYCAHNGSGVYGSDYASPYGFRYANFAAAPGMREQLQAVRNADALLPLGVENWQKFNGGYGGPLIVDLGNGECNKIYGSRAGGAFAQVVIGCRGVSALKAKQPCHLLVYNPATGSAVFDGHLNADQNAPVPAMWGYVLVGSIG